jgi:hypothetical protein
MELIFRAMTPDTASLSHVATTARSGSPVRRMAMRTRIFPSSDAGRQEALLLVPSRTPTLDDDARALGLSWIDLGGGYWRVLGGKFPMLVVEIDAVADQPDEDLLGLYAHSAVRTPRAIQFWGQLVGSEAKMEMRELEGYEKAIKKILKALPEDLRLADIPPEKRLAGLAPEKRLAGLAPEQRLAGLAPEQAVLAMPVEILRALSADYLASLPEATRAEIERRLRRS